MKVDFPTNNLDNSHLLLVLLSDTLISLNARLVKERKHVFYFGSHFNFCSLVLANNTLCSTDVLFARQKRRYTPSTFDKEEQSKVLHGLTKDGRLLRLGSRYTKYSGIQVL